MIKAIMTLLLIVASICTASDDPGYMEILVETINAGVNDYYKFEIKPDTGKTVWCQDFGDWDIITNYTTSSQEIQDDNCGTDAYGFDICYSEAGYPDFWITLNRFTIYKKNIYLQWEEIFYFYLDNRDCRLPGGAGSQDISIMVNASNSKVYYDGGLDRTCNLEDYTEITVGQTLKIWEVNNWSGSHDVSCMCPIPEITSIEADGNEHPVITWEYESDPNGFYTFELWRLLTQFTKPLGT
jgi:hypothetical protein